MLEDDAYIQIEVKRLFVNIIILVVVFRIKLTINLVIVNIIRKMVNVVHEIA